MDLVKQLLLDEKYRYLAMEESWLAYLGYHGGGSRTIRNMLKFLVRWLYVSYVHSYICAM